MGLTFVARWFRCPRAAAGRAERASNKMPAVERSALIAEPRRPERAFLLDLLSDDPVDARVAGAIDAEAFLAITPRTLYPWVHWRLRGGGEGIPQRLRTMFAEAYRENALRQLRRVADVRRIDGAFHSAGVPYLLLKGPVLAATVYPDPATRTMTDLDFLVRDRDMERAMAALAGVGYQVPSQFAGVTMHAGDAPPLFNGQAGSPVIELHSLLDSAPDDPLAVEEAWATSRMVDLGHGVRVPALGRAEFFAHVVTHLSRHHRFEGELRSLLDVALLLRSDETELDWASLRSEWTRRRIAVWIELTLSLARILIGAPLPKEFRDVAPAPEVLALASEQLWVDKDRRISLKITQMLAGSTPAPVHSQAAAGATVPMPTGREGMHLRVRRKWQMLRRTYTTLRDGTLRPRTVARSVALFRNRERLFTLVESSADPASLPERPPR